ncbi:hypothetical protein FAGKG844_170060 [Frankia sp. AgKG'84/4]
MIMTGLRPTLVQYLATCAQRADPDPAASSSAPDGAAEHLDQKNWLADASDQASSRPQS